MFFCAQSDQRYTGLAQSTRTDLVVLFGKPPLSDCCFANCGFDRRADIRWPALNLLPVEQHQSHTKKVPGQCDRSMRLKKPEIIDICKRVFLSIDPSA